MPYLDRNALIPEIKLTQYLLIRLPKDDKSKFLEMAGYTLSNWQDLERDIRTQILRLEAKPTTVSRYGQKYEIDGILTGINGMKLNVKTVWIVKQEETRFVTLVPKEVIYDDRTF